MKTRIISALVGTVVLLGVLLCPNEWVFVAAMALLSAFAVWEFSYNTGILKNKATPLVSMLYSALSAFLLAAAQTVRSAATPAWPMPADALLPFALVLLAGYVVFMLVMAIAMRKQTAFASFAKAFLLTLYATLGFSCLAALRVAHFGGLVSVVFVLVIAWMSDTGAYFSGVLFGKHKMAPVISPKKTWEGFFGGWVFAIGCAALFAVICNWAYASAAHFSVLGFAVIALFLAPLSVLGDLLASLIKRRCGIKDYGNLMPGHGGVMDRFDSVVFIAPLLYAIMWVADIF